MLVWFLIELSETTRTFQRSYAATLQEVRYHALSELERFINASDTPPGKYSRYADRLVAICLVQGAAQHFVELEYATAFDNQVRVGQAKIQDKGFRVLSDGRVISGIKDMDVIFFFREDEGLPLPRNLHLRKSVVADFFPGGTPFGFHEERCC